MTLQITHIFNKHYSPPIFIDQSLEIESRCDLKPLYHPSFMIKTQLLDHQVQGMPFLIDCESPKSVSDTEFWERISSPSRILWQHKFIDETIITSHSYFHPPSPLGSILAHDMGLEKSLEAIYLVENTLNSARNYYKSSLSTISGYQETIIVFHKGLIENLEEEIIKQTQPNNLNFV
ncbi:hypothetical protein O181_004905 [Austropuccinia psidii MF-1]|uniref:SNF2 N-terminal domain-containing protein n=1 Tax=Austropuccinia psidii MF-1 TaxID=1389203 RepID=A0A9Q3GFB2_9BASI|nr:hypothetical protein [Austropuccinia psidii MF-1]